ncbi:MAG: DUF3987 domain-containing protein [Phycisphaeraceae bacterium]|nr:DUF3987 domain-containing protein [Phycisphaeraceae bacterium]
MSDNLEMIDFDNGGEAFEAWRAAVEEIEPGLTARMYVETTPSGGRHVVYRCESPVCGNTKLAHRRVEVDGSAPVQVAGKTLTPRQDAGGAWHVVITLIETRGEGGMFLCAPSPGYEALAGNLASPPVVSAEEREVLLGCAWRLSDAAPAVVGEQAQPRGPQIRPGDDFNARGDAREILRRHGWEMIKSGENEHWRRPGKQHGTSATLKGGVFYVFSSNAAPFEPNQAYAPFAVFALLEHCGDFVAAASALRAKGFGGQLLEASDVDLSAFSAEHHDAGIEKIERPGDPGPFPQHLLTVPGLIGEVVAHNVAYAPRPQPQLALASAIALQAVLAGRKVCDERGNRTNLYCVGLAKSGAGKDHARKLTRDILFAAGADDLEGNEDLASDAGLFTAVESQPAILFQLDEFGRFLRTIGDPKKAPHLFNVLTAFMKFYSSADTFVRGKAYADAKRNKSVDQPCVVLYGTTVPDSFWESLTSESLSDGFIGRLLVFECPERPKRQRRARVPPPKAIVDRVRWWNEFSPGGNLRKEHPKPLVVTATPEAAARFDALADHADAEMEAKGEGIAAVWSRAEEKACRLALIYACSANPENPVIEELAASWACDLSSYVTRRLLFEAHVRIADGQFDARQKRVLRIIDEHGGTQGICHTQLLWKTRWLSVRERQEVIDNLIATGQINEVRVATKGRSATRYVSRP